MIAYYKYLIGGALIGALLITGPVFDYSQSLQAQLPAVLGIGDTSDNIIADLGDVDKNDNPDLLVTVGDNNGVTLKPTHMSPTLSPSPNLSPSPTPKISPSPSVSPKASPVPKLSTHKTSGKVVLNEIAWAGTGASPTDEWLELYNAENEPIDISGWRLVSGDGSPDITFKEDTVIAANSYFLIERTDDDTINDLTADLVVSFGNGLNNDGEVLWLINAGGIPADSVGKTGEKWPAGDATAKLSMERNGTDWQSFSGTPISHDGKGNPIHGTPKRTNGKPPTSTPTPTPTPTPSSLPSPTPIPTPSPTPTPSATPEPEPPGEDVTVGAVVINEIAWMGTSVSLSNDEWVELYNTTNQTVNLDGWILKSTDGTPNITLSGSIGPFGFYLLERTADTTISDILADKIYTGAFINGGEYLELKDATNKVIDFIDSSAGWQAGDNATKSSMERTDAQESGNDPANWHTNNGTIKNGLDAGGNPVNGTPKAENS